MLARAFSVADPERVRGRKPSETPGAEEKKTQKKDKARKERKKCGPCLHAQGDRKAGWKKCPAAKAPCLNSSFLTLQSGVVYQDRNATAQRISSARLHKIKELKNEIFDIGRKIEASSLENQALKELNRRHARAIGRYNNAESHLQGLLAGHHKETTELGKLLKMSQEAEKNTAKELKKVEAELRRTNGDLKTLVMLSEDKALAEREELSHRLSVLNKTLEAKDERIQEKDRQLYIQNIYANRMPKALRDRSDWLPNDQSLRADRSVQVDKESFRELLLSQHQDTEKNPMQLKKEKRGDKGGEGKAREVCSDAWCRKEKEETKKVPTPETSNRTHGGGKLLMEKGNFSEFIKEMEKETEFLKQKLKSLMKSEQNPQREGAKNNQEGEAVEEVENEEKKPYEQQKKKARSEEAIPSKDFARLKKIYLSSEGVESLHQGLHTSGAKCKAGSQSQAGQSCRDTAESRGKISFGAYEPSFGQIPLARQGGRCGVEERPEEGGFWGGLFARRQPLELHQQQGEGRQVRGARQIPNSRTGFSSPH
ncbi:lebercilin-like protein isoform X3 [Parus major]|uniref:lebercilin-like protein isoform X3 n=1 Tax=Parus major TaxID=9157 RepID=UPI00077135D4|nr:lebercilin-like protein isoform X3 [Parus major]